MNVCIAGLSTCITPALKLQAIRAVKSSIAPSSRAIHIRRTLKAFIGGAKVLRTSTISEQA